MTTGTLIIKHSSKINNIFKKNNLFDLSRLAVKMLIFEHPFFTSGSNGEAKSNKE